MAVLERMGSAAGLPAAAGVVDGPVGAAGGAVTVVTSADGAAGRPAARPGAVVGVVERTVV